MFNYSFKKVNLKKVEKLCNRYNILSEENQKKTEEFLKFGVNAVKTIENIEKYINLLANSPKSFEKKLQLTRIIIQNFTSDVISIKKEAKKTFKRGSELIGVSITTGASIVAFAPTAAMNLATTFGTASTGTAISSLSGAAATNAALAWLGGGSLAVGGGGMATGSAFLALAGPVGWTIGGVGLLSSAFFFSNKNKKIAKDAINKAIEIKKEINKLIRINNSIDNLELEISKVINGINISYQKLLAIKTTNFINFTQEEQFELASLVNNTNTLAKLLIKSVE